MLIEETDQGIITTHEVLGDNPAGVRRKDFPMTDNINWLKWIVLEKQDGKMHVYTEDVPTPYIEPPRTKHTPSLARL